MAADAIATDGEPVEIWGVVTTVIKSLLGRSALHCRRQVMFALVDANNMYVSCERVFAPRLAGKPVVVLSSNDGACIARSNEAKDLGVAMAQPRFQVRHLERSAGLSALSANFELYGDMSSRMMSVIARYAPRQEVYSIDESFLDFESVRAELAVVGKELRAAAKLAHHVAKTADRKPGTYPGFAPGRIEQVCDFDAMSQAELDRVYAHTEGGAVWGAGMKIGSRLIEGGICTVLDLVRSDTVTLRRQFSFVLEKTVLELRGTSCVDINDVPAAKQQILVSRSFGDSVTQQAGIVEAVSEFASRAAEKLRQQDSVAAAVTVFFTTSPYRQHDTRHSVSVTVPLVRPTADTRLLEGTAAATAVRHFRSGFKYTIHSRKSCEACWARRQADSCTNLPMSSGNGVPSADGVVQAKRPVSSW